MERGEEEEEEVKTSSSGLHPIARAFLLAV